MIVTRGSECGFYEQVIKDFPSAKHRGLLVDTARHYLPTSVLKAVITSLRDRFNSNLLISIVQSIVLHYNYSSDNQ